MLFVSTFGALVQKSIKMLLLTFLAFSIQHDSFADLCTTTYYVKYVVKHKSANLFMTYAVGKLEAALNISH